MQTPRRRANSVKAPPGFGEAYESPPPPRCCQGRLFLLEYGILIGIQLLCLVTDLAIWIVGAYSVVAAFCLVFALHCLILLPAIFLPLVVDRVGSWLKRLRDWGVFHRYDWNIAVSAVTIISTVIALLLVLFCQPLFFLWTHETLNVGDAASYDAVKSYSSFKFNSQYHLNLTMLGEKISYPVGDPNGAGVYYNCFAPILEAGQNGPNLFWAACPWQKVACEESLATKGSCVNAWTQVHHSGILWSRDIEYILHDAIVQQSLLWNLPAGPAKFMVIHWEDVKSTYKQSLTVWWASLVSGNVLIIFWWIVRRPFLRCFCTPANNNEYAVLN